MDALRGTTALVTGGCGFIGSHLVRRLVAGGARRVVVVDSLRYGDRRNLADVSAPDRVEVVPFTLGTDPPARLAAALAGVDWLFHLAAEKHNQSRDDPDAVLDANVRGTRQLFDLAAQAGVQKTVFASSLYAYGRLTGPPMVESEVPAPRTVYGVSKLCGEHLLACTVRASAMRGDVLRYFFTYGPRQLAGLGYKSVIVRNFERIAAGEPPVVYGDGTQALDYVFVDDVVDATIACMAAPTSGALLNVGSGEPTSIAALTAAMLAVSGARLTPVHAAPDWTAGTVRVGAIDRARATLGWAPRTPLAEGLRRTWAWLRTEVR